MRNIWNVIKNFYIWASYLGMHVYEKKGHAILRYVSIFLLSYSIGYLIVDIIRHPSYLMLGLHFGTILVSIINMMICLKLRKHLVITYNLRKLISNLQTSTYTIEEPHKH